MYKAGLILEFIGVGFNGLFSKSRDIYYVYIGCGRIRYRSDIGPMLGQCRSEKGGDTPQPPLRGGEKERRRGLPETGYKDTTKK